MPSRLLRRRPAALLPLVLLTVLAGARLGVGTPDGAAAAVVPAASARAILTVAGTGSACAAATGCGDGGPATAAPVSFPAGVAVDAGGDLLVVDWGQSTIRRVTPDGRITTLAGNGVACQSAPDCGDGGPATAAELSFPTGVAVDRRGDIFIADSGDDEVREVLPNGRIVRLAGTGTACPGAAPCGDGGPARSAQLNGPEGVAVDSAGNVLIADTVDQRIRAVSPAGTITTLAGTGTQCANPPGCGDGGPPTAAQLAFPAAVAVDGSGRVIIADDGDNEVRQILRGRISRLAGTGVGCTTAPRCGDGGPGTAAQLASPQGVAVDGAGEVVVADWGDNEVRVISARGTISRLAGTGFACSTRAACGDGGSADAAALGSPQGVAADAAGDVWVADTFDAAVRLVPAARPGPRVGTVAPVLAPLGTGAGAARGSLAVRFALSAPASVTLSVAGRSARPVVVARVRHSAPGVGEIVWSGRVDGRRAPRGRYTLTLRADASRGYATASLRVSR